MPANLTDWKSQIQVDVKEWQLTPPQTKTVPIYAYLATSALLPLIDTLRKSETDPLLLMSGLPGSVGTNVLMNYLERWKEATNIEGEIEREIIKNKDLLDALDHILLITDTIRVAEKALSEADRQRFVKSLSDELKSIGSSIRYAPANLQNDYASGHFVGDPTVDAPPPTGEELHRFIRFLRETVSRISEFEVDLIKFKTTHQPKRAPYWLLERNSVMLVDLMSQFSNYSSPIAYLGQELSERTNQEIESFSKLMLSIRKKDRLYAGEIDHVDKKTALVKVLLNLLLGSFETFREKGEFPEGVLDDLALIVGRLAGDPTTNAPPPEKKQKGRK